MSLNLSSNTKPESKDWGSHTPQFGFTSSIPQKEKGQGHLMSQWGRRIILAAKAQPPKSQESCAQFAVPTLV